MSTLAHPHCYAAPTQEDMYLARVSGQHLSSHARQSKPLSLTIREAGQDQSFELPPGAVTLLVDILEAMAAGRGVAVIPENAELTTVEAASILNVSRPFLIGLLSEKAIPYRLVGKHRRIMLDDVMTYKKRIDTEREEVLAQLAVEAQENDFGYSQP